MDSDERELMNRIATARGALNSTELEVIRLRIKQLERDMDIFWWVAVIGCVIIAAYCILSLAR